MKNQIKESILEKRNSLSKEEIVQRSAQIKNNLFDSEQFKKSRIIMFFVSFNSEVHRFSNIKD